jgi:hypothetical protein
MQVLNSSNEKKNEKKELKHDIFNLSDSDFMFNIDKKSGRIIPKERPVFMKSLKKTINMGNGH